MNPYVGHPLQIRGVEEYILANGKGKGMRLLQIRNGKGLEFTISVDRCADISRLSLGAINFGYFSPCGYVAPEFYDNVENGFLKSFTAGFLTTCGLTAVGSSCIDDGEKLPLHGTVSNTPAEQYSFHETDDEIVISALIRDASLFSHQLVLTRNYICSLKENTLKLIDEVKNIGARPSPLLLLYHFNVGYPLLTERTKVVIPNNGITARNEHAAKEMEHALKTEPPQDLFAEQCYYYDVLAKNDIAKVGVYNADCDAGFVMQYNKQTLDTFTQWKMMGVHEYVLGMEPGNCTPDGRDVLRKNNMLRFIKPDETYRTEIQIKFTNNKASFEEDFLCSLH